MTSRNELCPCGSGNKFKRCHGSLAQNDQFIGDAERQLLEQRAIAMESDRVRQQGRGRPIISTEFKGSRVVAVGSQLFIGKWKTFHDFLVAYVCARLGQQWFVDEETKSADDQHPFLQWLRVVREITRLHVEPGQVSAVPELGAVRAVAGFAYDLYLVEHHLESDVDKAQFERLIRRLKHKDQFFGARHELRAAGMLLRAGFLLTWEEEQQGKPGGYGEFIATYPETTKKFWVECKMRQSQSGTGIAQIGSLLGKALKKETDLERLVFIELNLPESEIDDTTGGWPIRAVNQVRKMEEQPTSRDLPSALVLLSSFFEHQGPELASSGMVAIEGFKTDAYRWEYADLQSAINEREANPEIESLLSAIRDHSTIPASFDGTMFAPRRYRIGDAFALPSGALAQIEDGTVLQSTSEAYLTVRGAGGEHSIVVVRLDEDELQAWRQNPETFFGVYKPYHPPAESGMDLYEFFLEGYAKATKENLIEWLGGADRHELQGMAQPELVRRYASLLTAAALKNAEGRIKEPAWYKRVRNRRV